MLFTIFMCNLNFLEPVFCCNFDKAGDYIVTGGQDDTAYVWNVLTKTIKFECTGKMSFLYFK